MNDVDVAIVGAGPAGSALAAFLGARRISTLLVDPATFPREAGGGETLSPEALGTLDRLGVLGKVESAPHRKLFGLLLHSHDGTVSRGTYRPVGEYAPYRPYGLAARRDLFEEILFRHAASYPSVRVEEGFRVDGLLEEDGRIVGIRGPRGDVRSWLVVGADGPRSVVGRALGGSGDLEAPGKLAFAGSWKGMAHEDYAELHMGVPGTVALSPVDQDLVDVKVVVDRSALGEAPGDGEGFYRRSLEANPRLRERLGKATLEGPVRRAGSVARRSRGILAPGAMLLGDAEGFVDPFTGEGLYIALRSAELAARFILEGSASSLRRFARARRAEFGTKLRLWRQLQKVFYRPALANYVVHRLAAHPRLADRLTALWGDYVPTARVMTVSFILRLLNPFLGSSAHVAG